MATTEIHAITTTPELALKYIMSNKLVEYKSEEGIWDDCDSCIIELDGVKYVEYKTYTSFYHCDRRDPMQTYRELQRNGQDKHYKGGVGAKKGEPVMYHLHQSFRGREVDPITANMIGQRLCEEVFKGFAVTVCVHTNGNNIHTHFMISAWNRDGYKWHDCHATKRMIRKVSDALCREYGLSVLESTKDMKLVSYKDAEGKTHYYEPTDRKNELINKRRNGEISTDDVNSYRNTAAYEPIAEEQLNNRETVKRDIDNLLPHCLSYEELLIRLREMGYKIKDKKKNGDWLAHVSFRPPTADKATREDKIGDGEFYLRENLMAYIAEQAKTMEVKPDVVPDQQFTHGEDIPVFEQYEYGETDIDTINEEWRKERKPDGTVDLIPRTPQERKVIRSIRDDDLEVRGLIDTNSLRRLIAEQRRGAGKRVPPKRREQILVERINNSFRCLRYTEQHGLYSYQQMIGLYSANKQSYHGVVAQYHKLRSVIDKMKTAAVAPARAEEIQRKIDQNIDNPIYALDEKLEDQAQLAKYRGIINRFSLHTPENIEAFSSRVAEYESRLRECGEQILAARKQMEELENCIMTYDRIDREYGKPDEEAMREFRRIQNGNPDGDGEQNQARRKETER